MYENWKLLVRKKVNFGLYVKKGTCVLNQKFVLCTAAILGNLSFYHCKLHVHQLHLHLIGLNCFQFYIYFTLYFVSLIVLH